MRKKEECKFESFCGFGNNKVISKIACAYISNKKENNENKTQEQRDNSNSGDTKAIGQDVSSKVPPKAEEKKEESFSNELAENLYKYLRG